MQIMDKVTILRGALHDVEGTVTAVYESSKEVEVNVDFLTTVVTDMSNVKVVSV